MDAIAKTGPKAAKAEKRRSLRIMRASAQLTFLALFVLAAWAATYPPSEAYADNIFLRTEPLNALLNHIFIYGLVFVLPALIILVLTVFSGRFFCAWICPLGTCFDFVPSAGRHGKPTLKKMRPRGLTGKTISGDTARLRLKYVFLAVLAVLYIANIGLIWLFDPLVIVNRAVLFLMGRDHPRHLHHPAGAGRHLQAALLVPGALPNRRPFQRLFRPGETAAGEALTPLPSQRRVRLHPLRQVRHRLPLRDNRGGGQACHRPPGPGRLCPLWGLRLGLHLRRRPLADILRPQGLLLRPGRWLRAAGRGGGGIG